MPFSIVDGKLEIPFEETVSAGLYGFEITGKDADGRDWRFYAKPGEWIEIVEATSDEYAPDNSESYYDKTVQFGVMSVSEELLAQMRLAATEEVKRQDAERIRLRNEEERQKKEMERERMETERQKNELERLDSEKKRQENGLDAIQYTVID